MPKGLNKKMGPLPVWAWGMIFGVVGYFLYERQRAAAGSSPANASSPTASVLDPNAIDPNTGLTYGQEEDAALNANAAGVAGASGGGFDTTPTQGNLGAGTTELQDLDAFLQGFGTIATDLGYTPPGVTTNQTIPDVVTPANAPITKPQVNPRKPKSVPKPKTKHPAKPKTSHAPKPKTLVGSLVGPVKVTGPKPKAKPRAKPKPKPRRKKAAVGP